MIEIKAGIFTSELIGRDPETQLPIFDKATTEDFWNTFLREFATNGISMLQPDSFQVIENEGLNLNIKNGRIFIGSDDALYFGYSDNYENITLSDSDADMDRIDRIVMRLDVPDRIITIGILEGEPGLNEVLPQELTRNDDIYEMGLADIFVGRGTTEITQSEITDLRTDEDLCGVVKNALGEKVMTEFFIQYESQFMDWFKYIKETYATFANYESLENKPSINGITLSGDKSTHELKLDSPVYVATPTLGGLYPEYTHHKITDDRLPNSKDEFYDGMQIDVYFAKRGDNRRYISRYIEVEINNIEGFNIATGKNLVAFEDIEEGSIQTLKYYNGDWFLMSPPTTKWESFIYKLAMAPLTNLSSVQITSAIYRDGFISLVFRCYVSKALTAGTVMKARINIEDFAIASLCSGGGYLGRATIVGTLGTSGEFNINFSGADFGATANFLFAINIPVDTL